MIDMAGLDWSRGPSGGIYLMGHDTSRDQVARGGGGLLRSQKVKGWDGGRFVPGDVKTSAEAIVATGLDWKVAQRPILKVEPVYVGGEFVTWNPLKREGTIDRGKRRQPNQLPTGGFDIAEAHVMNVREDTGEVLGVVGPGWANAQNTEMFEFVDSLVEDDDAKWLGGGEIGGGKRVWLCAQFSRSVLIGGDENERSIPLGFFSNGWDGTLSLTSTVAPYRLACLNGQSIPLEGYVRTWKARHTAGLTSERRVAEARRTLKLSIGYFDAWTEAMNRMITEHVSQRQVERVIETIVPFPTPAPGKDLGDRVIKNVQEKRLAILDTYRETDNLQHLGHTKYRVLNAVTAYADWTTTKNDERQMLTTSLPSTLKDAAYRVLVAA